MGIEKCSKCDSLLDEGAQAFVFGGEIVCGGCDELLRKGYNILGVDAGGSVSGDEWDVVSAKKMRRVYLLFFVLGIFAYFTIVPLKILGFLLYLICQVLFLVFFLTTARLVKGYSITKTVFTCIGLFIPFVSLILLFYIDGDLYKRIKNRENPEGFTGDIKRRFCVCGLCSFLLFLLPLFGLPLGIFALVKISKSEGRLYGMKLAWVAVVFNTVFFLFYCFCFVLNLME